MAEGSAFERGGHQGVDHRGSRQFSALDKILCPEIEENFALDHQGKIKIDRVLNIFGQHNCIQFFSTV